MEKIEMVEKLQEKTGVSAEEAWNALDKNNWVIVDAMLWLEKEKGIPTQTGKASSADDENQFQPVKATMSDTHTGESIGAKLKKLLHDSLTHCLVLRREHAELLRLPLLLLLILLCSSLYVILISLAIALLYGCQFSIEDTTDSQT